MSERNPYAPPKAHIKEVNEEDCKRDGKWVIVRRGCDLPARCIVCNASVTSPIKTSKLHWHTPWLYLLLLVNIIIYVIVGLIVRKSFSVAAGLCDEHERRRKRRTYTMLLLCAGLCTLGVMLMGGGNILIAWISIVSGVLFLFCSCFASRKTYAHKITKDYASLGGCKEPFLASLE